MTEEVGVVLACASQFLMTMLACCVWPGFCLRSHLTNNNFCLTMNEEVAVALACASQFLMAMFVAFGLVFVCAQPCGCTCLCSAVFVGYVFFCAAI